jgi:YYY domain-containing protein
LGERINLNIELQIISVISWLLILTFIQISVYPLLKKTFGNFAFPASFSASLLIFTIITWYCGLCHLPVQLALLPFLVLLAYHIWHHDYTFDELKKEWRWEVLFLLCFLLMLDVRFVNPTISYAEKFMDHAFLASVIRAPIVPPLDPWFAGGTLNVYYYLGYWMFGCLAIVSGVPSNIAFNLALPTVFGIAAVNVYAIGTLMLNRFRWLPLLVFFLPNPSFVYQIIQGKAINTVFWDSTRTITNTINEYPLFSFIWGDVHAHVVSIFNQVFLIFLLLFAYQRWESLESRGKWLLCILAALSLGSMPLFNTWDVLIYAPITLGFGALILWRCRKSWFRSVSWVLIIIVPPAAFLFYLPFYLQLKTSTGGLSIVQTPSNPFEFLLVNGWFIALFFVILIPDIIKRPYLLLFAIPFAIMGYTAAAIAVIPAIYFIARVVQNQESDSAALLATLGLVILIFCELFYLRDNMGDTYFRMNTVFKCYLPAWILLGIAVFSLAGRWLETRWKIPVLPAGQSAVLAITLIGILFIIPFLVPFTVSYGTYTLDGLAYLKDSHSGDAPAIAYLRSLSGDEIIVEAEGGDYTYYSRVSSFTGIPGIIGMPFHEFMWRGDDTGWFSTRNNDIRAIYEQPDKTIPLMKKYQATLLYLGDAERERYKVNITPEGLDLVYSAGGTEIYRL